jgi:hypothetical protein
MSAALCTPMVQKLLFCCACNRFHYSKKGQMGSLALSV